MKPRILTHSILLLFASLTLTLPAVAKDQPAEEQDADKDAEKDGKKNTTILILTAKPDAVHAAALQALASIGCQIKKDTPEAIEAKRPNKVGLAVGSGGEKLFIAIKGLGENRTELKVITKKTMVGIIGQKLWNLEVAKQISDAVK
jgi:hypothetical protein